MPEGVVEKQPDRAAVWTFQEVEAVGGSEIISFNSRAEICTLRRQIYTFSTTSGGRSLWAAGSSRWAGLGRLFPSVPRYKPMGPRYKPMWLASRPNIV
jgi:hypothetical protein